MKKKFKLLTSLILVVLLSFGVVMYLKSNGKELDKNNNSIAANTVDGNGAGNGYPAGCYNCSSSAAHDYYFYYPAGASIPSNCSKTPNSLFMPTTAYTTGNACSTSVTRKVGSTNIPSGFSCGQTVTVSNCSGGKCTVDGKSGVDVSGFVMPSNTPTCGTTKTPAATATATVTPTAGKSGTLVDFVDNEGRNSLRYVLAGATMTGSNATTNCGDQIHVLQCTNGNSDSEYCTSDQINGATLSTPIKIYRNHITLDESAAVGTCGGIYRYTTKGYFSTDMKDNSTTGKKDLPCGTKVEFTGSPANMCYKGDSKSLCQVKLTSEVNGVAAGTIVYIDRSYFVGAYTVSMNYCEGEKNDCTNTPKQTDVTSSVTVTVCMEKQNGDINSTFRSIDSVSSDSLVECATGYKKEVINNDSSDCNAKKDKMYCSMKYTYKCSKGYAPSVAIGGSTASSTTGLGTLSVQGTDNGGGVKGYYVSQGSAPTKDSQYWTAFDSNDGKNYTSTLNDKDVGTWFAWAISNDDNISYPASATIFSSDSTTTLKTMDVKDADGNIVLPEAASGNTTGYKEQVVESGYVRLSNRLKNDSVLASFDPFSTGYFINTTSNKIAVYATLTSTDSAYVEGYEPRTVDLNYGRNVILIKIKNSKNHIRTYSIIVTRTDDRNNDNTLSTLTVSKGTIDFDPFTSNYNIEVPKNTDEVTINGTLSQTSSTFDQDYAPRKVELKNKVTSAVLKVRSQSGSIRSYVLTFIKSGSDTTETYKSSTNLSSLTLPGSTFIFSQDVMNYSMTVGYDVESLPVYAFSVSPNATVQIEGNDYFNVGPNTITITVTNGSKSKVYSVNIIRKEDGLGVSSDTTLSSLTVKGYTIDFKSNVTDYVLKIKHEKTLVITATPNSNRSDVYMYGNNDLTGFSMIRIKVIAEDGETKIYSLDIQKDAYNKTLEITVAIIGGLIILGAAIIIIVRKKKKKMKDYLRE